mmetsp:Transcript_4312/g.12453  ORF Transcript_4312/g.12453 Transcript_4312/m.12453 type:complete len:277 (+) Transcript_4312:319-1149(+)
MGRGAHGAHWPSAIGRGRGVCVCTPFGSGRSVTRRGAQRLSDGLEQVREPRGCGVEALAALDAGELDGAELVVLFLVVANDACLALEGALDSELSALLDEMAIRLVGGGRAGVVAALLHEGLLRADARGELLGKVLAHVDGVELDVPKRVARHIDALRLELAHDVAHAGALGDEDVDAVVLVHYLLKALALRLDVDVALGHVDSVHAQPLLVHKELGEERVVAQVLLVLGGGCRGEPAAVTAHNLVHNEHARVRRGFGHDVREEAGALLRSGEGAE